MTATALVSNRRLNAVDRGLLALSLACGAIYLVTRGAHAVTGSVVIKALSIAPLALFAFRMLKDRDGLILGVSLLFSTLGDVFLAVDEERLFTFGLASFLIAHVLYVVLFARHWSKPVSASAGRKMLAVVLVIFSAAMFAWLWNSLGDLKLPVAIYLCAITGMGIAAALAGFRAWWVIAGAMLFIVSDSMIAASKFKFPIEYGSYLIWATYYVGQFGIALGFIREKHKI